MIYTINDISFNVECNLSELKNKIPVLFLHGFTGSLNDWNFIKNKLPINFTPIFIDLLGHGKTSSLKDSSQYSFNSQIELLHILIQKLSIKEIIIVGYSMGGRLALSFAMKHPEKIRGLVLESTSFGIENKDERENRIIVDEKLAERINNSSMKEFIQYWINLPLFESLKKIPASIFNEIKKHKVKSNNSIGLINSLNAFGTGRMKNYFPFLSILEFKILLITGELDFKFTNLAEKANDLFPDSEQKIVSDVGHIVHLEKTEEFLKLLSEFLLNT